LLAAAVREALRTCRLGFPIATHAYQNDSCDITKLLTLPLPFVTNLVTPSSR